MGAALSSPNYIRIEAGISGENPWHQRKFTRDCGAKHPETLRLTALRKHVETKETTNSICWPSLWATISGQFYRLPEDTLQLAKLSKLFLLMETRKCQEVFGTNFGQSTPWSGSRLVVTFSISYTFTTFIQHTGLFQKIVQRRTRSRKMVSILTEYLCFQLISY